MGPSIYVKFATTPLLAAYAQIIPPFVAKATVSDLRVWIGVGLQDEGKTLFVISRPQPDNAVNRRYAVDSIMIHMW